MREACFYEKKDFIYCNLCPLHCVLKEGQMGKCRARKVIEGKLYSLNYGEISAIYIEPIEKKPIADWMQGSEVLSIGSFGCNFHCDYCQNYSISLQQPSTRLMRPEDIVDHALLRNISSIAYTYNEPTIYYEMMYDTAKLANENGVKNIMVTNGFIEREPLNQLLPYIDAMNIDLKTYSDSNYKALGGISVDSILDNISFVSHKCHLEISLLIVPGINDSLVELEAIFQRLQSINKDLIIHITRYFPSYKYYKPATNIILLMDIHDLALKYFKKIHIGNVRALV